MNEKKDISLDKKVMEEMQKRKDIIAEANTIIELMEQQYENKKEKVKSIDVERIEIINQIYDITREKDINKLDELFERLR